MDALTIDSVRAYFGSKHYVRSSSFWGAIGTLACFVLMLSSVPGSRPSDPIQYEHIVLVGVGFSLLSLIGTLLRATTLRGNLPEPPKPPREKAARIKATEALQAPPEPLKPFAVEPSGAALN